MKKCSLLLFVTLPVYGALSPHLVKESALKFHPSVQAALEKWRAGEEAITASRGAFDTKIVSDYKRQTKDDYRTTLSRSFLEKPLRLANSKIYAGFEQISNPNGMLSPIYNTGNPTSQTGNYTVLGARVSLWKNFMIDEDRAQLKNAKYDAQIAKAEKRLTELQVERLAQLAYWEWVTAKKVEHAYEELLQNGLTRNEYLTERSKKGDVAKIIVTENEQYVASRKRTLQSVKERFLRAEYGLSLFYRDQNGEPVIPNMKEEFEDYPSDLSALIAKIDLNSDLDELAKKRPDIKSLSLNVEKSNVDIDLAKQELKPKVDVTTEYFKRSVEHPNMPLDYMMVMAQVSIPIERNLGNGQIAAAKARQIVAQKEMSLGLQTYKFEVMALRKSLNLRLEQVLQSQTEFNKARELVISETYKFKTGGSSLFLVNLREDALASAEASFHEARLAFMDTYLSYQAMVQTGL